MSKFLKVLTLVVCLSLIVCAVVISTSAAENGRVSELSQPWQYTTSSGTVKTVATLSEAVSSAPAGSTIKLLCDQIVDHDAAVATINKNLTVDLGGNKFMISQSYQAYIGIGGGYSVTFKNGTLVASGNSEFGKSGIGYAIFRNNGANVKLTLENVNTYSSCILLSGWASSPLLTINGGEHYIVYGMGHMLGGGIMESRKSATAIINNALIYVSNGLGAVNVHSFNAAETDDKTVKYTFNNSKIITGNGSDSIIGYANENATFTFNGCDIFGSVKTTLSSDDANKGYKGVKAGAIVFGGGTRVGGSREAVICQEAVCKAGEKTITVNDTLNYALNLNGNSLYYDMISGALANVKFFTKPSTYVANYDIVYGDGIKYNFSFDQGGKTCFTNDIHTAIENAESTIKLNAPASLTLSDAEIAIHRDLAIDLSGYTLTIIESGDASLKISEDVRVTIKNGAIVKRNTAGGVADYPVFSAVGDNVSLDLTDVSVDATSLILIYNDGCKVNVSGGTHGNEEASNFVCCAYVDIYAKADVSIDNAVILVGNLPAFSSLAEGVNIALNGTSVFGNTSSARMMDFIGEGNKIILNDCDVFASLEVYGLVSSDELYGAIVLGEGTRLSKLDADRGIIVTEYGKCLDVKSNSETLKYTSVDGTEKSKLCTFEYTVVTPDSKTVATYLFDGITLPANDIKTALSLADAGSEVILVKNVTLTEGAKGFIEIKTENLTLNLGGNTLEVIQTGEASIDVYKNFKIKNGTIRAAMDPSQGGKSYPVLRYAVGQKGINITLENVNTYAGSFVFAWDCSGHSLNVIGGKHHAQNSGTGCDGGWLDVRGDFKLSAKDASFFINDKSSVVSSLSFKDTDKSLLTATFDFVGCKIISENGKSGAIAYANANSRFSFTDCDIYASINPTLNSNDSAAGYSAIKAGAIVLGGGVRLSSLGTFISGGVIVPASGCVLTNIATTGRVVYEGYSIADGSTLFVTDEKILNTSFSSGADRNEDLIVTVKWFKEDGVTLLREDKINKGSTATPPSYTPGVSNGWYKTGYSGWSKSFSSTVAVSNFTVIEDTSFYPCISGAVTADLTVARYNLSLIGKVSNNLFLPVTPAGITVRGVYVNGVEIPKSKVVLDGVKYYMYTVSEVGAARLDTVTTVTVKYIVGGTVLSENISLRPIDYAEALLRDSTLSSPVYSSAAHTLAADLIRYSNALCLVVDGATDSKLNSLIKTYGALVSELVPSNSFAEYRSNTAPLKGIISSVSLEVSATEPRWIFNVASGVKIKSIIVEVDGYLPTVTNGVNFGKVSYKAERNGSSDQYFTEHIPIYNLDRLMTIRVILEDGSYKEGKYSLNAYYGGFDQSAENAEDIRNFIKAFRTLGISSSKYKYGNDVKTGNSAVDFFACDHESIGSFRTGEGRYCPDCATYIFFYSDFGAVADGQSDRNFNTSGTNNHEMMYMCHKAANDWKLKGNKTAVQAVGGAHNGTCYYIGKQYNKTSVSIMTDTSWAGAEFIVDDRSVKIPDKDGFAIPVFTADVESKDYAINYTSYAPVGGLAAGSKNVGFAPGRPMMLQIMDKSRRNNIRQGANENTGESIHEMILVDEYGNISNDTPVEWDYYNVDFCTYGCTTTDANSDKKCDTCTKAITKSMAITGYAIDCDPITISGLDKNGNIDFIWETVTDNTVYIEHYTQCSRRFKVQRSNVTVMGIDHYFTEDDTNATPRTAYAGVVNVFNCNNTTVKDILVVQHISHAALDGVGQGSYEFSGGNACNVNLIGYRAKNFFDDGGKIYSRGMFGTNYIRNFYVKDCVLTSFDSHSGAYNAVIEDSVFEHVNFVGGGNAYVKNVTVYVDKGQSACVLRQDYGSMWHGNIYFDGLKLRYSDAAIKCIDLVEASYTNWNFGTDTYLPETVIANNVTIERYSRSVDEYVAENGTIRENIVGVNEIPLGVYYNVNKQLVAHADYSTVNNANLDAKHPPKRFELNNSGNLKLTYPDHTYFSKLNIFIDGVQQDWFTKRSSLNCEDMNGDYICDICTYEIKCTKAHPTSGTTMVKCDGCGNIRYKGAGETLPTITGTYEYVFKGNTTVAYSGTTLSDVISAADSGSTIKLLTDNTDALSATFNINKNITIDLNGKTFTVYTPSDVAAYNITDNRTLTWQNGTVICMVKGSEYSSGRALTSLGINSTVNYNNVTAFVACLAFSYNSDNVNININGGAYYAIATSASGQSSFIETRANVTLTAKDAIFCMTNFATSKSYYFLSGTNNYTDGSEKYNNYTFTNCDIVRNDKGKLVFYTNEFTKIYLNDCRVYGTLNNGNHYNLDSNQGTAASKSGLYVIGAGTRLLKNTSSIFSSTTYIESNATYASGCSQSSSTKSISYTFKKISGKDTAITISNQSKSYSYTALVS